MTNERQAPSRNWWLTFGGDGDRWIGETESEQIDTCDYLEDNDIAFECVHVVEYSVLEAMTKERDELRAKLSDAENRATFWHDRWFDSIEGKLNDALTKDRDAWKLMAEKLVSYGYWNADSAVLREFADMVKELG